MGNVLDGNAAEMRAALTRLEDETKVLSERLRRIDQLQADSNELRAELASQKNALAALDARAAAADLSLQAQLDETTRGVSYLRQDMLEYVPAARVRERTSGVDQPSSQ